MPQGVENGMSSRRKKNIPRKHGGMLHGIILNQADPAALRWEGWEWRV